MKFTLWRFFIFTIALLLTTGANATTTNVSCVYETIETKSSLTDKHEPRNDSQKQPSKWFFWRTDKEIEVSNAERSFGEKWINNNQRSVFYQALYHDKKFLLDFQPADLKILGKQADWEMRSNLFPQSLLTQLERKNTTKFNQYDVIRYEGKVAGIEYRVDWIAELKLPARVEKNDSNTLIITELKEVYMLDKTPYKQTSTEEYEAMDYADIGDNESHPVVAQLQKNVGIGYFHNH